MKLDFTKDRDSIFNYLVITSSLKLLEEVTAAMPEDKLYEITMQVNGVKVDAERFVNRWQENVARNVEEKAKELIREKFEDFDESLFELTTTISDFEKSVGQVLKKKIAEMTKNKDKLE